MGNDRYRWGELPTEISALLQGLPDDQRKKCREIMAAIFVHSREFHREYSTFFRKVTVTSSHPQLAEEVATEMRSLRTIEQAEGKLREVLKISTEGHNLLDVYPLNASVSQPAH